MEERKCKEMVQKSVESKCQDVQYKKPSAILLSSPQIDGCAARDTKIVAPTPEKANESVRSIHNDETAELPENYKVIAEFFNHFACSLRLLALRKKLPSLENISRQVEVLSGRKFTCKHLSQIKHILPEAVYTDKILIHDKNTLCMKPDIKISLSFDVIEGHQEQSPYIALHQLLTSRLVDVATKLPMVCEIPEAEMPKSFNQRIDNININPLPEDLSTESQHYALQNGLLSNSCHLSPSFSRCFSNKMAEEAVNKTPLLASQILTKSSSHECSTDQDIKSVSGSTHVTIPVQLAHPSSSFTSTVCEATPLKPEAEAGDLTLQTPAQLTPQRSVPSCDKLKTMTNQIVSPYSAKRSLDFSTVEGEEDASKSTSDEISCLKVLDHTLHQTIAKKGLLDEDDFSKSAAFLGEGEKGRYSSKDLSTNKTSVAPQQMLAGLSDLIALIYQIFQSISYSAITKDELIYKIMINNCEIVERREVEEQIGLLETLVPDWFCNKLVPSGDILYNIKKQSDPNSVCNMLYEQVTKVAEETVN